MTMLATSRLMRAVAAFLFVLSLASLSFGLLHGLGLARSSPPERMKAGELIKSIGAIRGGKVAEFTIAPKNQSGKNVTILGGTRVCRGSYCVEVEDLPVQMLPFEAKLVRVRLFPKMVPGDFHCPISLFTDLDGNGKIDLEISGTVYLE